MSPLAAAAIALGTATPAAAVVVPQPVPECTADAKCSALLLGGTGSGRLTEQQMEEALGGYFADDTRFTRQNVRYPGTWDFLPSIGIGTLILGGEVNRVLAEDPEANLVIGGFSQGAAVASQLLYRLELMGDEAPDKDQLRFVLVADPYRGPNTNVTNWLAPPTKYDIILVATEYDGIADAPDRWWNVLANWNASLGALYLHVQTTEADLDDVPEENITVYAPNAKGGVITKYLIPTETLPLVKFMPWLKPYEETLKRIVDAGYSRNDDKDEPAEPETTARAAARQTADVTEVVADETPQQETENAAPEKETALEQEPAAEPVVPAEQAAEEPADDEVTEDAETATEETAGESTTSSTGTQRTKRGSENTEKITVAEIKNRLAEEAEADAESTTEAEAADESGTESGEARTTQAAESGSSGSSESSSSARGADRDAA
ncbi:PE-PPE domain-containing protein [Mycolicibacterium duvalii]|uniref:PE-PPE domain-containing protein n=1 Tax=Mycolicibacterium duvalii TaxID=39688 RepID=UPI0013D10E6F|nr:PE-PPE domain-containing protein [Mycolicibacterium duvalii]MCV7369713.1 PE-PPE domain-containing protein [Mycolicibacterium duvalii]